jgi:hypothetical protein
MHRAADQYRQEAEECRKLAESAVSQPDKEAWLRLAADWVKLAESAEQRRRYWGREGSGSGGERGADS